jgi:hypothetical protein
MVFFFILFFEVMIMKADRNMTYDGHFYKAGEELPNLGSFECVSSDGGKRNYYGLSDDAERLPTAKNLPKYSDLATGSFALCLDTGDSYFYHAPSQKWYKQ